MVLPVLLLLLFGMVNFTHYAYMQRKVATAAQLMADLVTRAQTTITRDKIDDYFTALELSFRPMSQDRVKTNVGIDVYNYFLNAGTVQQRWSRFYESSNKTPKCTAPDTSPSSRIADLAKTSDVVVAVVCMRYTAPVANFPGFRFLSNINIERSFILRPRETKTLSCTGC